MKYKSNSEFPTVRQMQELYADYPCGRREIGCIKPDNADKCTGCPAWKMWVRKRWNEFRRYLRE